MKRATAPPPLVCCDWSETECPQTPLRPLLPAVLICPGLYLGSMQDAADALWGLNPFGIKAVVNCAQEEWVHQVKQGRCGQGGQDHLREIRSSLDRLSEVPHGGAARGVVMNFDYLSFSAQDRDRWNGLQSALEESVSSPVSKVSRGGYAIENHFGAAIPFIQEQLSQDVKVLVHCLRGENRSAAVCAAFLIAECGYDADSAVNLLRAKRGENALTNGSFVEQLRDFSDRAHPQR